MVGSPQNYRKTEVYQEDYKLAEKYLDNPFQLHTVRGGERESNCEITIKPKLEK